MDNALYLPKEIRVTTNVLGEPTGIIERGKRYGVEAIHNSWRIDDEWWRREVSRIYYEVIVRDGSIITIFHDLITGKWYKQRC